MQGQPSGTVTLVFTDMEGSTRLLAKLGTEEYKRALTRHRSAVREAFGRHQGYEVDYEGDAFFYAFQSATAALAAVQEAVAALAEGPISVRVGVHTGEPSLDRPKYVGMDVHRAARIMGPPTAARSSSARAPETCSTMPTSSAIWASTG
jgi:class 3 adenylate cyclase